MNYEQILDEIMVNTVSAKQLIWYPQVDFHYAVCPRILEFHTTIFLSSALLALNQEKSLVILIQVQNLPDSAMFYTWKIWPHFWRIWDLKKNYTKWSEKCEIKETKENYYEYLDKLFCYLSVINVNEDHLVIFVKQGESNNGVKKFLSNLLKNDYSLLVISNCYSWLPTEISKEKSKSLINHFKRKVMDEKEQKSFPALNILSELLPSKENPNKIEQLVNTWDIWFGSEKSTDLRFMMS